MGTGNILGDLPKHTREAVRFYWQTRAQQLQKQREAGGSDQGLRSAVTGGAQMDGFIELLTKLVIEAGIDRSHIFYRDSLELPGYFRPNKKWDFLVVAKGQLVAALEAKSQVGLSIGENFNNQTEEAICSALEVWQAFRKQALAVRPWVGYLLFVEKRLPDKAASAKSLDVRRSDSFCRRLVFERFYDHSAVIVSNPENGSRGGYSEPAWDLTFRVFANSLFARVASFSGRISEL